MPDLALLFLRKYINYILSLTRILSMSLDIVIPKLAFTLKRLKNAFSSKDLNGTVMMTPSSSPSKRNYKLDSLAS